MTTEWNLAKDVTIGIGGAAGDGLDKTGDTLARTAGRLGLYVYAYNAYQSIIRVLGDVSHLQPEAKVEPFQGSPARTTAEIETSNSSSG